MAEIVIDTAELNRDTTSMTATLRQIQTELEGMYQAMKQLNRMWEGPANQTFTRQFGKDYENMQAICQVIQSLIQCMQQAGREYQSGDQQVSEIISSIRM